MRNKQEVFRTGLSINGEPTTLQPGDLIFYNTEKGTIALTRGSTALHIRGDRKYYVPVGAISSRQGFVLLARFIANLSNLVACPLPPEDQTPTSWSAEFRG